MYQALPSVACGDNSAQETLFGYLQENRICNDSNRNRSPSFSRKTLVILPEILYNEKAQDTQRLFKGVGTHESKNKTISNCVDFVYSSISRIGANHILRR